MENTIKERVRVFCLYKKIPVSKFESECGLSNAYISSMRKGFGGNKLNNVLKRFPELNRDWLLYGEGDMLKSGGVGNTIITGDINGNRNNLVAGSNTTIYPATEKQLPNVGENLDASPEFSIRELIKSNQQLIRQQDELIAEIRKQNERNDKLIERQNELTDFILKKH